MSKPTLYGMRGATCTQRVLMTLAESGWEEGKDFDFKLVDVMKGEHKQPEHLARNPYGQIPALEDEGFIMYESRAICRYLEAKAGGKLVPKDPKVWGRMEQLAATETQTITPEVAGIAAERVFKKFQGTESDENKIKAHVEKLEKPLDILNEHLSKNEYLAGNEFSLVDIFPMPYLQLLFLTPEKSLIESRPHVSAWWKRISTRPTWKKLLTQSEFLKKVYEDGKI